MGREMEYRSYAQRFEEYHMRVTFLLRHSIRSFHLFPRRSLNMDEAQSSADGCASLKYFATWILFRCPLFPSSIVAVLSSSALVTLFFAKEKLKHRRKLDKMIRQRVKFLELYEY